MNENNVSIPSYNPAEVKDMAGLLNFFERSIFLHLEKVTPAQIISYDRNTNRASVQILNYSITSDGAKIIRKPEYDIPVTVLGAGGYCLSFPVNQGDIGFLIASDGDISVFKKILGVFAPAVYQRHKYKNSFFIPLIINNFTINAEDAQAVLLTSLDGQTRISLQNNNITVTSQNITVNSETAVLNTDDAEVNSKSAIVKTDTAELEADTLKVTADSTFIGDMTIQGDITQLGSITQTGSITNTGNITSAGTVTGTGGIVDGTGASGTFSNQVTVAAGIVKSGS